jgi:hypothetical protein
VEHDFRLLLLEQRAHEIAVPDVLDDQSRTARNGLVEVRSTARREVVENDDFVPSCEQCIYEIRSYEPGSAGHQSLQAKRLLSGFFTAFPRGCRQTLLLPSLDVSTG